jgi:diaminopimelate epimerase
MKNSNYNPGGNFTTLIDNQDNSVSSSQFSAIAKKILKPPIEQIGFISNGIKTDYKLEMMGGEMCVNALRSLGLWIYQTTGDTKLTVESSGTNDLINLEIQTWSKIILPRKYTVKKLSKTLKIVLLEGICHFVLENPPLEEKYIRDTLQKLKKTYSYLIQDYAAIGLMCVDKSRLIPLVEVIPTKTQFFETACGSGTLAAYIASNFSLKAWEQPSGSIFITNHDDNHFYLNGPVEQI